jgi:hypothetical protein
VTSTFRDMILKISPGWLQGSPSRNGELDYVGSRYLYSIALHADLMGDKIVEGISKRFAIYIAPGDTEPDADALTLIGRDTTIPRGPNESSTSYATRNQRWIDDLKMSGNAFATLRQIQGYLTPQNTTLRLVNNWGVWYTLSPDYTTSLTISPLVGNIPNWNWDNRGPWAQTWESGSSDPAYAWSRFWVIIYCNGGVPFGTGRTWGDGTVWGAGWTWGSTATVEQVTSIRNIVGRSSKRRTRAARTSSSPSIRRASTPRARMDPRCLMAPGGAGRTRRAARSAGNRRG